MTSEQVQNLLKMLRGYWPNYEWDKAQNACWAIEFAELDYPTASDALRQMARTSEFPSVAKFTALVAAGSGFNYLGASGKLVEFQAGDDTPELGEIADKDAVVAFMAEARARLRKPRGETA